MAIDLDDSLNDDFLQDKDDLDQKSFDIRNTSNFSIYDFKKPNRVSKNQLRAFKNLHDKVARSLSTDISALLRTAIDITLQSVDQMTYNEFVSTLPSFTSFNVFSMKPLEGKNVVEMNVSLVYSMLNILLGGTGDTDYDGNKEFTDIELNILDSVLKIIMKDLQDSWKDIIDINPIISNKDSSSNVLQVVSLNEIVVLVVFLITIGNVSGFINICYPVVTLDNVMQALDEKSVTTGSKKNSRKEEIKVLLTSTEFNVDFEIGSSDILLKDVLDLKLNDIVKLNSKVSNNVSLVVDKDPQYILELDVSKYNKKFRVKEAINSNDTLLIKAIDRIEKSKIEI